MSSGATGSGTISGDPENGPGPTPAPTNSMYVSIAGNELIPARARSLQRTAPVAIMARPAARSPATPGRTQVRPRRRAPEGAPITVTTGRD
jgi:hypothetical protein